MKLLQLLVICTIVFSAKAEDSLSYSYQTWSVGVHTRIADIRPHITFNFRRHQIGGSVSIDQIPNYYLDIYGGGSYHHYLAGQTGRKVKGSSLFYRIYPFRPCESFSFYIENQVQFGLTRNVYINGAEVQKVHQLTEAVLIGLRYKLLKRFSIYVTYGRGVSFNLQNKKRFNLMMERSI
jgi:hypothetical protein